MVKKTAVTVIVTVLNEAHTIEQLLHGLVSQTVAPAETIIVDGGSTDSTLQLIKVWHTHHTHFPLRVFTKVGNRSIGRNYAIKRAAHEWIAITDAGCIPDPHWLAELLKMHIKTGAPVIAGFYTAHPQTPLQEAIVPYMLVMPDKANPDHFLPATRSMLIEKKVWAAVGRFDETYDDAEDYPFAQALAKQGFTIAFARQAIVSWRPISSLTRFIRTVTRFAHWDVRAGVVRPKALLVLARYAILLGLFLLLFISKQYQLAAILISVGAVCYILWSIAKNKRYVPHGWYWLPVLQILADVGVLWGTLTGALVKIFEALT